MASLSIPLFGQLTKSRRDRANSNATIATLATLGGRARPKSTPQPPIPIPDETLALRSPVLSSASESFPIQLQTSAPTPVHVLGPPTPTTDALAEAPALVRAAGPASGSVSLSVPVTAPPAPGLSLSNTQITHNQANAYPYAQELEEYAYDDDLFLDLDQEVDAKVKGSRGARDRRIRRWLEQQCRFVLDVEEGWEGSGSGSGSSGEEESCIEESADEMEGGTYQQPSKNEDNEAARDAVVLGEDGEMLPLSLPPLSLSTSILPEGEEPVAVSTSISSTSPIIASTSSFVEVPNTSSNIQPVETQTIQITSSTQVVEIESDRADSPLLGYPSSPGSASSSSLVDPELAGLMPNASTSHSHSVQKGHRVRHTKSSSGGTNVDEDPLRFPSKNYVRVLSGGGEREWAEGVRTRRKKVPRKKSVKGKGKEREVADVNGSTGRDKPLPPPPPVSRTASPSSLAVAPAPTLNHAHTSSITSVATSISPISPSTYTSTDPSTSQTGTPESSFTVPTSVSVSVSTPNTSLSIIGGETGNASEIDIKRRKSVSRQSFSSTTPIPLSFLRSQSQGVVPSVNANVNTLNMNVNLNGNGTVNRPQLPFGPVPPTSVIVQPQQQIQHCRNASGISTTSFASSSASVSRQSSSRGVTVSRKSSMSHSRSPSNSQQSHLTHSHSISRANSVSVISRTGSSSRRSSVSQSVSQMQTGSVLPVADAFPSPPPSAPGLVFPAGIPVATTAVSSPTLSRRPSMLMLMHPPSLPGLGEEESVTAIPASASMSSPTPQFHLPTSAIQTQHVRRMESMSQMQQQQILSQQISPLPPNMPPTRRSRAGSLAAPVVLSLLLPQAGSGSSVHLVDDGSTKQTQPAPSRTRSRAGSLSLAQTLAQSFGGSGLSLDGGNTSGSVSRDSVAHGHGHEQLGGEGHGQAEEDTGVLRNAVYIDSEEVRERLDMLIGRAKEREDDGYTSDELFLAYDDEEVEGGGEENEDFAPNNRPTRPAPAPPLDLYTEQNLSLSQDQTHQKNTDMNIGVPIAMSMSRWSLASSAMEEEEIRKSKGKEKKMNVGQTEASPPGGAGGSARLSSDNKKRGRLVSFISRLSAAVVAPSLPPTPTEGVPPTPPLPSPTSPMGLPPSPLDVQMQPDWPLVQQQQTISEVSYAQQRQRAFTTSTFPNPNPNVSVSGGIVGVRGRSSSAADLLALGANQRHVPLQLQQQREYVQQPQQLLPSPMSPYEHGGYPLPEELAHPRFGGGQGLVKSASASILRTSQGQAGQYRGAHVQIARGPVPRRSTRGLRRPLSGLEGPEDDGQFDYDYEDEDEKQEVEEEEEDYGVVVSQKNSWPAHWEGHEEMLSPLPSPMAAVHQSTSPAFQSIPAGVMTPVSPVSSSVEAYPPQPPPPPPLATIHRLKSLPSLVNLNLSSVPSSGNGSINLASPPSLSIALPGQVKPPPKEKAKGLKAFVQRMGLNKSSNTTTIVQADPRSQEPAEASGSSSLTHSPNSSLDATKDCEVQEDLSPRSPLLPQQQQANWPTQTVYSNNLAMQRSSPSLALSSSPTSLSTPSIGSGLLASLNLSKQKQPLSASKALGGGGPKRKLCISGVALDDVRAVESVKAWCESFGEVKQMTRSADGSLLVDFKKASVAETVCRVQAQVYIKGVGSVNLSWYTKKKPNF